MSRFFARAEEDNVWASVLLTLLFEATMIDDEARAYFQSDLGRGLNSGYFTIVDDDVAVIIVTASLNAIVNDSLTKVQQTALLQSMLQELGMTKAASKKAVWDA